MDEFAVSRLTVDVSAFAAAPEGHYCRDQTVVTRAKLVKLVILDVDGVLTDGQIVYYNDGNESKNFYVRDGLGMRLGLMAGLRFALISGRSAPLVNRRFAELEVPDILLGSKDKLKEYGLLKQKYGLTDSEVAVVGDDVPDLSILQRAGLAACPSDADPEAKRASHLVLDHSGGRGAVREFVEFTLKCQDRWEDAVRRYVFPLPELS